MMGRVPNNDVELHFGSKQLAYAGFDVIGVDEGVGVIFQPRLAVKERAGRSA